MGKSTEAAAAFLCGILEPWAALRMLQALSDALSFSLRHQAHLPEAGSLDELQDATNLAVGQAPVSFHQDRAVRRVHPGEGAREVLTRHGSPSTRTRPSSRIATLICLSACPISPGPGVLGNWTSACL